MATKKPVTVIYKKKTYTAFVPEQTSVVDGKFVAWNGENGKGGRTNVVTLGIVTKCGYGISLDKNGRPTATYKHVAPFEG